MARIRSGTASTPSRSVTSGPPPGTRRHPSGSGCPSRRQACSGCLGPGASTWSPAGWPQASLTGLKRSRSTIMNMRSGRPPLGSPTARSRGSAGRGRSPWSFLEEEAPVREAGQRVGEARLVELRFSSSSSDVLLPELLRSGLVPRPRGAGAYSASRAALRRWMRTTPVTAPARSVEEVGPPGLPGGGASTDGQRQPPSFQTPSSVRRPHPEDVYSPPSRSV